MSFERIVGIIAALSSVSGLTIVSVIKYIRSKDIKSALSNPYVKTLGIFSLLSVLYTVLVFSIPWYKIHYGNIPATFLKPNIVHDTIIVKDSFLLKQKNNTIKSAIIPRIQYINPVKFHNQHKIKQQINKIDTFVRNQTVISGGTNVHTITGNGNYDIVNGDQYNYNGVKQRHISDEDKVYLKTFIPNKSSPIKMFYPPDKESTNYANEIYKFLVTEGYQKIIPIKASTVGAPDFLHVMYSPEGTAILDIPVATNIQ